MYALKIVFLIIWQTPLPFMNEGNTRFSMLDNLFNYQQPHQHIHLKEKKKNHSIQI